MESIFNFWQTTTYLAARQTTQATPNDEGHFRNILRWSQMLEAKAHSPNEEVDFASAYIHRCTDIPPRNVFQTCRLY